MDLPPLTELIDRQGRGLRQLTEAVAVWQVRALQAEERLTQLTTGETTNTGEDAPQAPQDAPGEEHAGDVATDTPPRRGGDAGGKRLRASRNTREVMDVVSLDPGVNPIHRTGLRVNF